MIYQPTCASNFVSNGISYQDLLSHKNIYEQLENTPLLASDVSPHANVFTASHSALLTRSLFCFSVRRSLLFFLPYIAQQS